MKHMMKIALLAVLATGLVSCDLFNVDVETTISGDLDITVDDPMMKSAAEVYSFNSWTTLDPGDDAEVEKYKDQIVEVGVDNIIAEVEYVSDGGVTFLPGTYFVLYDDTDTVVWPQTEPWVIEVGTTLSIDNLDGRYDDVAAILDDVEEFTVGMVGTCSKAGVEVTVRIDIESTITGSIF